MTVHKTFRRRPGRLLNVLYTFNLRLVSRKERNEVEKNYDKFSELFF